MQQGFGIEGHWIGVHENDPRGLALYKRHYSRSMNKKYQAGKSFVGPGEKMVLITLDCKALFVWHPALSPEELERLRSQGKALSAYRSGGGTQSGVMCSIFRNEGPILSSALILEAEELAWRRWPNQRLFTYVWDAKIKSVNPGYCYKMAGWKACGRNSDGRLTILEKWPMKCWYCWKEIPYQIAHESNSQAIQEHVKTCPSAIKGKGKENDRQPGQGIPARDSAENGRFQF